MSDEKRSDGTPEADAAETEELRERVIQAIKTCYDPEVPVDIWELGLIYNIDIKPWRDVEVTMTLTSPHCPVAESLPGEVERKVAAVEGVAAARVEITWEPPWTPDRMSEAARLELNL